MFRFLFCRTARRIFTFLVATSLAVSSNIYAQVDPVLAEALQHTLDSVKTSNKLVGVSAAIILPDKSVWTGASGMSDPDSGQVMAQDMHLGIGSITKTFTTAIIMQLAAENKLSLDDSLHKWLPGFQNIDSTITIKQLLSHTSGIYNYTNNIDLLTSFFLDVSKKYTPEEILSYVKAPSFVKGTSWEYSNTNFILLGMIIKNVTGTSFSTQLHNRITIPFNLSNTFLEVEDTITGKIAAPWSDLNGDGRLDNFSVYPRTALYSGAWTAGGMFSTAEDIARWAGLLYGGEVVEQKYLDQMVTFSAISNFFYGLGTIKDVILNRVWWGHSGSIIGYNSYTGYSKQDNISIAVLLNRDNANLVNTVTPLLKTVLEYKPVSVSENFDQKPGEFYLAQNYPNPFNPNTSMQYSIGSRQLVTLKIYDILGKEVATLVDEEKEPGTYIIKFNASGLPSGIYFYRLTAGMLTSTKKFILLK